MDTRGQNEKKKDEHTRRGTSENGGCRTKYVCTAGEQVWRDKLKVEYEERIYAGKAT